MEEYTRVLQVAPLRIGGVTELVLSICENIDRSKLNFDYLAFGSNVRYEKNEQRAKGFGGQVFYVDLAKNENPIIRGINKFISVYRIVKENNFGIIHINTSTPYEVLVAIPAKMAGAKRVIMHSHNSSYYPGQKLVWLTGVFKAIMPFVVTDYFACSDLAAEFMFPQKILKEKKYTVLKNGVNVDKLRHDPDIRAEYRRKYGLENAFVIGNVGRFNVQKNHSLMIDIFAELYKTDASARLFLVGMGETEEATKEKVKQMGLQDVVYFNGPSSEVNKLMQMFDVVVMPSLYEGLPVVGVEAQAADVPLVLTDTITKELQITDAVTYVPLDAELKSWVDAILDFKNHKRHDTSQLVREAGFDIKATSEWLQNFYLGKEI